MGNREIIRGYHCTADFIAWELLFLSGELSVTLRFLVSQQYTYIELILFRCLCTESRTFWRKRFYSWRIRKYEKKTILLARRAPNELFLLARRQIVLAPTSDRAPPRETSAIWALKFHTDHVLTRIRSNESDRSIYLTPRNSKAKQKARRRKAESCLGIFFKSVSMMFVASFKLSPLGKSSFRRSILLFVDKMSLSICRRDLVNRWYSRVLLKVGMPECCNAAMPEIESRNTKTQKH